VQQEAAEGKEQAVRGNYRQDPAGEEDSDGGQTFTVYPSFERGPRWGRLREQKD